MIICELLLTKQQMKQHGIDVDKFEKHIEEKKKEGYLFPVKICISESFNTRILSSLGIYLIDVYEKCGDLYGIFETPYTLSVATDQGLLSEIVLFKDTLLKG